MKQTECFKDGFHRFYRQTANLNLYIQNTKRFDASRVAAEIRRLSAQLENLSSKQEEILSKKD